MTCRYCKEDILRKDVERHERHDYDEVPTAPESARRDHDQVIFFALFGGMHILLFLSSHIECLVALLLNLYIIEQIITSCGY